MRIAIAALVIALAGCAQHRGYMIESGPDPSTGKFSETRYSPYYELEQRSDDQTVLARLVITLGGERVPKGHVFTGPFSDDPKAAHETGLSSGLRRSTS
jgi:hypothetical protein